MEERRLMAVALVTNTNDSGFGSLRAAIDLVNSPPTYPDYVSYDEIDFNIGSQYDFSAKSVVQTITPLSPLPALANPVLIDGTTQNGFDPTNPSPVVVIDGSFLAADTNDPGFDTADGLDILGGQSTVRGLAIDSFGGSGLRLAQYGSDNVQLDYLGVAPDGVTPAGNRGNGVEIDDTLFNVIGAPDLTDSASTPPLSYTNLISANGMNGVLIQGPSGTPTLAPLYNRIAGNDIGTTAGGRAALGNQGSGIALLNGASNITVTGDTVSGNAGSGVLVRAGSDFDTIIDCLIGMGSDGATPVGNSGSGVVLDSGANSNIIDLDTISGNLQDGVTIQNQSDQNQVENDYIGTNSAGNAAVPNHRAGVWIADSSDNLVGSTPPVAVPEAIGRNVISGNLGDGIRVRGDDRSYGGSPDNRIKGNLIGTDSTGMAAIPNSGDGVLIEDSPGNAIGGAGTYNINLISGNLGYGVQVSGQASVHNVIGYNLIGPNAGGTLLSVPGDVPTTGNALGGVSIDTLASQNLIGAMTTSGSLQGGPNVISGNGGDGVDITDTPAARSSGDPMTSNLLVGNTIGLSQGDPEAFATTGATVFALPNTRDGVLLTGASGVQVGLGLGNIPLNGSILSSAGNVISGNAANGVEIVGSSSGDTVQGNFIGTDPTGESPFPNGQDGLAIDASSNVKVGGGVTDDSGATSTEGNVISANLRAGIEVTPGTAVVNGPVAAGVLTIAGNKIGTNLEGTRGLSAAGQAVGVVVNGDSHVTIGGTGSNDANLISGNPGGGIQVEGGNAPVVLLTGNLIGTDVSGSKAIGNGTVNPGVFLNNASGVVVSNNVISGNLVGGLEITGTAATGNLVVSNKIGVDASGGSVVPVTQSATALAPFGVLISGAPGNLIGDVGVGNVIALGIGGGTAVVIDAGKAANPGPLGDEVRGNFIGTNPAGAPLGNDVGVYINGASGNTIGGVSTGDGNVISTSQSAGVYLFGTATSATQNMIQGNQIGAQAGTAAPAFNPDPTVPFSVRGTLGNGVGVFIQGASGNTVAANTIVANFQAGVYELGGAVNTLLNNDVQNNGGYGVAFNNAPGNTNPAVGNTLGGNTIADVRAFTTTTTSGTTTAVHSRKVKAARHVVHARPAHPHGPARHFANRTVHSSSKR